MYILVDRHDCKNDIKFKEVDDGRQVQRKCANLGGTARPISDGAKWPPPLALADEDPVSLDTVAD